MASGTSSKSLSKKLEKVSPSERLITPKLEQSLVVAKDLKDQPNSKFILLTGAGRPVYYAVDGYDTWEGSNVIAFYRGRDIRTPREVVYVCRQEGTWALVARNAVNIVTDAEMAKHQIAEGKQVEAFYEQLDPEGWKEAQRMVTGGLAEMMGGQGGHVHGPRNDDKPVPGQYL